MTSHLCRIYHHFFRALASSARARRRRPSCNANNPSFMPALFRAEMVRVGSVSSTMSARRFKELGGSSVVLALALPLSERASERATGCCGTPSASPSPLSRSEWSGRRLQREDNARKKSSLFHGDFGFAQRNGKTNTNQPNIKAVTIQVTNYPSRVSTSDLVMGQLSSPRRRCWKPCRPSSLTT